MPNEFQNAKWISKYALIQNVMQLDKPKDGTGVRLRWVDEIKNLPNAEDNQKESRHGRIDSIYTRQVLPCLDDPKMAAQLNEN